MTLTHVLLRLDIISPRRKLPDAFMNECLINGEYRNILLYMRNDYKNQDRIERICIIFQNSPHTGAANP